MADPPDILPTLQGVRAKYPAKVTKDQCVAILNETAWIHRADGMGLFPKAGGYPQPRTGIPCSADILEHQPSAQWADVLGATGSGDAIPVAPAWAPAGDPAHDWLPPALPEVAPPDPPDPPSDDLEARVASLEAAQAQTASELALLTARVAALEASGSGGGSQPGDPVYVTLDRREVLAAIATVTTLTGKIGAP